MPIIKVQQLKSPSDKSWSQRSTSTPNRNTRDRLLKPLNSVPREGAIMEGEMSTLKSNGSIRSASKRSESSASHLKNQDNRFEVQHENMMSRQQFRTNTNRSRISKENGSIYGTQSYDSGFSHISRKSDPIPQTILKPEAQSNGSGREEHIRNVKVIIAGTSNCSSM
jgi:hypothetical protein